MRRMGMVMRRVYQLFRCRLLIKHHQTPNLLTINALIHYLPSVFSPSSLTFPFSFPLGLCLSPLFYHLFFPFCFSLSNTPNAGQINYLMHLSLSAGAQSNLPLPLFTHTFSQQKKKKEKSGLTSEKGSFFCVIFSGKKKDSSCPSKSNISRAY